MENTFYTSVEKFGNTILFRGYKNGKPVKQKVWYKPSLFVPSNKPTKYTSLDGEPLGKMDFESMKEAQEFVNQYSEVSNFAVHGQSNFVLQFIGEVFGNQSTFDRDLINVTTIDIEVQSDKGFPQPGEAAFPVTAITIKNNIDDIFYTWGIGKWSKSDSIITDIAVNYTECTDEHDLLLKFLDHWSNNYPNCVTGWNSRLFDTVYLVNRIGKLLGQDQVKKLSPWGIIQSRPIFIAGKEHPAYDIKGIQQLDYLDLFRKFGYSYGTQESYKLDSIANVVLGEKKLDYSEYASLNELYLNDHQKFIDYNIKDVQIVDRLEDKMGLITLCMTVAYRAGVNIVDAFGSVGVWDAFIYNELKKKNVVVPPKVAGIKEIKIEGAHVKDPQVGMHQWVCSFDLNSLYPHLMMQYNMSPETIVEDEVPDVTVDHLLNEDHYNFDKQYCMSARGNLFRKDKRGIVPEIIEKLYDERSKIKRQMLTVTQDKELAVSNTNTGLSKDQDLLHYQFDKQINTMNNQQMATKILMNSLYGAMANNFFRYYDQRIAESITMSGQLAIRWAEKTINNYLNNILKTNNVDYIIAIDTDSLYVNLNSLVTKVFGDNPDVNKVVKFIDNVAKEKFEPILEQAYKRLADYMNAYEQKMVMAREVIADKGVWTGKKHYVLNVHNSEGVQYSEPKLKIMGIEAVRSSTPMVCRNLIKDTLNLILNTNESTVQQFIAEKRQWFATLTPEEVAFPRSVSNLDKWHDSSSLYAKGTPIHVRGTILHNHLLKKHKISTKYERIYEGEKIKFVYLKIPNVIQENVIAFNQTLPHEFNVRDYIDYEKQFQKAYLEPINNILSAIGWHSEKQNTLEDFFG